MQNIELIQEKAEIVGKLRSLIDKAEDARRDLTDDEEREYKSLDKRLDQVVRLLERSEKLDKFEDERKKVVNPFPGFGTGQRSLDNGGFSGLGEFLHSIA